ncbi:PucR family transcriptional regulator [Actinocrispum sp. NPDC049592]|uniref:PucR family transcriptional regulator n=1 Tax=Actinocrispum sp. NPDC049592 TaxID=3154835 RepID=UPI0034151BC7
MLSVGAVVRQRGFGLRVLAGEGELGRAVEWVHVSELADPGPFLRPGTLLLTTGIQLGDPEEYVGRLDVVGIGFGVGLSHESVPDGLIATCQQNSVPLLEVPLATRFADIVRFVADDLARTAVKAVRSTVDAERTLIRALGTKDPQTEIVRRLAKWLNGWAMALDKDRRPQAVFPAKARRELGQVQAELTRTTPAGRFSVSWSTDTDQISVHPTEHGYLAVGAPKLNPDAAGVIGIAANLLSFQDDQAGRAREAERTVRTAAAYLLVNGLHDEAVKIAKDLPQPPYRAAVIQDQETLPDDVLMIDDIGIFAADFPLADHLTGRAAVSDPAEDLPEAIEQARSLAKALTKPGIITRDDVAARSLLSQVDTPEIRAYAKALLDPLPAELLNTLKVFLAAGGSWAEASAKLKIHRHTLRYRIRKIEDLLGRSLGDTGARAELWLAIHLDK